MRALAPILLLAALVLSSGTAARAANISLFTLPEGNTILQLTDALEIATGGGEATADTRTIYLFEPDFGDPEPNTHDFVGSTWPYVYVDTVTADPGVTASISTANDGVADFLLINGNPVYQFVNDLSDTDANGNFGPWFFILPDGEPTQEVVPEPSTALLLIGGIAGLALRSRRSPR